MDFESEFSKVGSECTVLLVIPTAFTGKAKRTILNPLGDCSALSAFSCCFCSSEN